MESKSKKTAKLHRTSSPSRPDGYIRPSEAWTRISHPTVRADVYYFSHSYHNSGPVRSRPGKKGQPVRWVLLRPLRALVSGDRYKRGANRRRTSPKSLLPVLSGPGACVISKADTYAPRASPCAACKHRQPPPLRVIECELNGARRDQGGKKKREKKSVGERTLDAQQSSDAVHWCGVQGTRSLAPVWVGRSSPPIAVNPPKVGTERMSLRASSSARTQERRERGGSAAAPHRAVRMRRYL